MRRGTSKQRLSLVFEDDRVLGRSQLFCEKDVILQRVDLPTPTIRRQLGHEHARKQPSPYFIFGSVTLKGRE